MPAIFDANFLIDHLGDIKNDPKVALIELIANASDAGATLVKIDWPVEVGQSFSISDNGIGMTKREFLQRWNTLSFNRRRSIGTEVVFPGDIEHPPKRSLFGKSGKGRHAAFCFTEVYSVDTGRNKKWTKAKVEESVGVAAPSPFKITLVEEYENEHHGTTVAGTLTKGLISQEEVIEAIGSKFLIDPSFAITVNNQRVSLTSLEGVSTETLQVDEHTITITLIDSDAERNNRLRGVAWWVNSRLVDTPNWNRISGGGDYVDGRSLAARRYAFVVRADVLDQYVKPDWSGFRKSELTSKIQTLVHAYVERKISELLYESRHQRNWKS